MNSARNIDHHNNIFTNNKIPSIMKAETESLLSLDGISKKDSLHSSLLESEIAIDKDNILYNDQ